MSSFFHLNFNILKLSGLWVPNSREPDYKFRILYNTICISYSMIFFTIAELIALKKSSENMNDLIQNLNMSMSFILTCLKVFSWFYYRGTVLGIIKELEEINLFDDADHLTVILEEKKFKNFCAKSFFTASSLVPISAGILSLTETLTSGDKHVYFKNDTGYQYLQKLSYYSWVPFDQTKSKGSFGIAVVYQCLALLNCGYITVGLDMMFVALISLVSAHFTLSKNALGTIRMICMKRLEMEKIDCVDSQLLMSECDKSMKRHIKHLQMLIRVCEKLEIIYCPIVLMQVLISLVVLCTCLYLVSSIPIGVRFFGNELAYLLAIEIQVSVYCYVGDKLTENASEIPTALYESDWLPTSSAFKRMMLLTMIRMEKSICITIGKFAPLTLKTFVMIGKTSYSIFAMLKSRN